MLEERSGTGCPTGMLKAATFSPQREQKRVPANISLPQRGQCMVTPFVASMAGGYPYTLAYRELGCHALARSGAWAIMGVAEKRPEGPSDARVPPVVCCPQFGSICLRSRL